MINSKYILTYQVLHINILNFAAFDVLFNGESRGTNMKTTLLIKALQNKGTKRPSWPLHS